MEQTDNNFFNPFTHRNPNTHFLSTNSFTVRTPHQQFISKLLKLNNLKEQQRERLANFNLMVAECQTTNKSNYPKLRESLADNTSSSLQLNLQTLSQEPNKSANDKFIDKLKLYHPESTTNKKTSNSHIERCRIVAQTYDQLKKEVMKSKFPKCRHQKNDKINRSSDHYLKANISGITDTHQDKLSEKENSFQMLRSLNRQERRKKYIREKSHSESSKKSQRYIQISVAEFMEQDRHKLSTGLTKKFEEYQKQNERHGRSLQENCQQIESERNKKSLLEKCLSRKRKKRAQFTVNERLVYPIIPHAL